MRCLLPQLRPTATVAVLLTAVAAAHAEPLPDAARLAALFEATAFDGEAADVKLRKWQTPIWLKVVGEGSDSYRETIEAHADTLSALTGLDMALVPGVDYDRNMVVWFTRKRSMVHAGQRFEPDQDRLAALVAGATDGCYSLTYLWNDDSIIFAAVIVNNERAPAEIEHCLLEEMTKALGLPLADVNPFPSIFNRETLPVALSPVYDVLVRTLYDPRLTPGMALARAKSSRSSADNRNSTISERGGLVLSSRAWGV